MRRRNYRYPLLENTSLQVYRPADESRKSEVEVLNTMPLGVVTEEEAAENPVKQNPFPPHFRFIASSTINPLQEAMSATIHIFLIKFLKELEKI